MALDIDVIYENGILRPVKPLSLKEHGRFVVRLLDPAQEGTQLDVAYIERVRREVENNGPAPGIEEVRRRLASIPGSLSDDIIADRGER